MKNEWDLLLEARHSADAGEAQFRLIVLSPPRWTIFSGCPARVRGTDGPACELGPGFPAVLHELIRTHLDTLLDWRQAPPLHELSFRPGKHHPHFKLARTTGYEQYQGPGLAGPLRSARPRPCARFWPRYRPGRLPRPPAATPMVLAPMARNAPRVVSLSA